MSNIKQIIELLGKAQDIINEASNLYEHENLDLENCKHPMDLSCDIDEIISELEEVA